MTDYNQFNFPAFFAAESDLYLQGHNVVNPARCDIEDGVINITATGELLKNSEYTDNMLIRMNIDEALRHNCDTAVFLPGWRSSVGARKEFVICAMLGYELLEYNPALLLSDFSIFSPEKELDNILLKVGTQKL